MASKLIFALGSAVIAVSAGLSAVIPATIGHAAPCTGGVASDFNGDGRADLAIGSKFGPVLVAYANADGSINGTSSLQITGEELLPDDPESYYIDEFVQAGDFDGDCFSDLAVKIDGGSGMAKTVLIHGSVHGLDLTSATAFSEMNTQNVRWAAGDFNGDGYDDLAAGLPGGRVGSVSGGYVDVYLGSAAGLTAAKRYHQETPAVPGTAESSDRFGDALTVGDFNGDGWDDLAIGVPSEGIKSADDSAGLVIVLHGSSAGLTVAAVQEWHQDKPGVPGVVERYDNFGRALAAGDFDGDGYADLAIGAPFEDVGSGESTGMVIVLRGSPSRLTSSGAKAWHQDISGIPGSNERGDNFGASLAAADFDGDSHIDLAIGVPSEDLADDADAGVAIVIAGSNSGLTGVAKSWSQDTAGVPGSAEAGDEFGASLHALAMSGVDRSYLIVGSLGEDDAVTGHGEGGMVTILSTVGGGSTGLTRHSFPWQYSGQYGFGYDFG